MIKRFICLGLLVLGFLPTACSMHSGTTVSRSDTGQIQHFRKGVILSLHEVEVVGDQSGVGIGAGAVAGGLAGSKIGGDKVTSAIGAIGGAVAGGLAGAKIEELAMGGDSIEFIVQPDNGQPFAIVQKNDENLGVGERVLILESEKTRIIRDQTSKNTVK